eukprot:COSAG06_NODE_46375_length_347_cov_1.020161_1_plen_34_part_10
MQILKPYTLMLRGVGSDVWPCWARNLLFIVLGML